MKRPLPPPTLTALYPPVPGYRYFDAPDGSRFDPAATPGEARTAWWLAEHALLAYEHPARVREVLAPARIETIEHVASSSFAYALIEPDHAILAFRGTEAMRPGDTWRKLGQVARDWLVDAQIARRPWPGGAQVHAGFAQALDALWPAIEALLPASTRWWCCGHSLGGALAALAALRVQAAQRLAGVLTYGQPATGDERLASALDALPLLRIVNACDVVPELPPALLGYRHGGHLRHLDADRRQQYASTLRRHLQRLPANLRHGLGALTPIELIDHAPLHYAIKCYNAAFG